MNCLSPIVVELVAFNSERLNMPDKPKTKIIINPTAGSGTTVRRWPHIKRQLDDLNIPYDFIFTEKPGHAIQLAKKAADQNYRNVVAVGGDGTINEVVNGLLTSATAIQLDESLTPIDLGVINTGTGSDFVRSLGIPRNPGHAGHHLRRHADDARRALGLRRRQP